ncbi:MAG: signal transduction histidine kinase, partial [Deinococcus sp.]|nr:signal transduction histidine kinase [Deinococcus sp.]
MKPTALLTVRVQFEQDVVTARGRAKQLAEQLQLSRQAQTCFATAVSELARNALRYAGGGTTEYLVDLSGRMLYARVCDQGPGIAQLEDVLAGRSVSATGPGVGLAATRRLMDSFEVKTAPGQGTCVHIGLRVPAGTPLTIQTVKQMLEVVVREVPAGPLEEVRAQNQELLGALAELSRREEQLQVLNRELEDTNRGVVALYSELEDKAERLREASHVKSMFLSYMSHEFRTPLNSILGLTRLLQEQHDGSLTNEQHKQVTLTQGAARELLEMVNDLLDVAKVEAGKSDIHITEFEVGQLFATLRALFQPLLPHPGVTLVFGDVPDLPPLQSDEGKVRQILRNFISNALKFTVQGSVEVGAHLTPDGQSAELWVTDTGIGIAQEDLAQLFQDFTQIVQPLQQVPGTGLGLSLAHKLTELLGGQVSVQSTPGLGSRFSVTLPLVYTVPPPEQPITAPIVRLAEPVSVGTPLPKSLRARPLLLL